MEKIATSANPAHASGESSSINWLVLIRILGSAGSALLAQAALHGQLAKVEWAEEKNRLLQMLLIILLGFACVLCLMLLLGAVVLLVSWTSVWFIPALLALMALYGAGFVFAWRRFQALSARGGLAFAATREELAADLALIKSKL